MQWGMRNSKEQTGRPVCATQAEQLEAKKNFPQQPFLDAAPKDNLFQNGNGYAENDRSG